MYQGFGADNAIRTRDLVLTKYELCVFWLNLVVYDLVYLAAF